MLLILLAAFVFVFYGEARAEKIDRYSCHPDLCGTEESLPRENALADKFNLKRIKDDFALKEMVRKKELVEIPTASKIFYYSGSRKFRYALPSTKKFLEEFSARQYKIFSRSLKSTSCARTERYQRVLVRLKITDARGETPERRSTHTTGAACDISKRNLSDEQIDWIRTELIRLRKVGAIEVIEEKYNNAFHIFVVPVSFVSPDSSSKDPHVERHKQEFIRKLSKVFNPKLAR